MAKPAVLLQFVAVLQLLIYRHVAYSTTIRHLHVITEIRNCFAITDMIYRLENDAVISKQVDLCIRLPDNAFISAMQINQDGVIIQAAVESRQQANVEFDQSKLHDWTAARIRAGSHPNCTIIGNGMTLPYLFTITVRPHRSATVNITYQELLLRKSHTAYRHTLNIDKDQVQEMQMDVVIVTDRGIRWVFVPLIGRNLDYMTNAWLLDQPGEPSAEIQLRNVSNVSMATVSLVSPRVSGQLVILFEPLDRSNSTDTIQVLDGFFLHQFTPAPITGQRPKKNVIFVLDKSGSMKGEKLVQLKSAMRMILSEMSENDSINIILFDRVTYPWRRNPVQLTAQNRADAQTFIDAITAEDGTNLVKPLLRALYALDSVSSKFASMVLFLTDGCATVGAKDSIGILDEVHLHNRGNHAIFTLGFGEDADFELLKRMSQQNFGFARKIYEFADAAVQIAGFYNEISDPRMKNVRMEYVSPNVDISSLVYSESKMFLSGGEERLEMGRMLKEGSENKDQIIAVLHAETPNGEMLLPQTGEHIRCYIGNVSLSTALGGHLIDLCRKQTGTQTGRGFIELMWAHLSILDAEMRRTSANAVEIDEKILSIALKYGLVTRLTSMIASEGNYEVMLPAIAPTAWTFPVIRQSTISTASVSIVFPVHLISQTVISILIALLVCLMVSIYYFMKVGRNSVVFFVPF